MKYCDQIKAIVRNKTLSIEAKFDAAHETSDTSPLEMYAPYSRFLFTILDNYNGKKVPVKANVIVPDVPSIIKRTEVAIKKIVDLESVTIKDEQQESCAFTEKFRYGSFKGKSPGEILMKDPAQKENLLFSKKTLENYLAKHPTNADLMKAIDEAILLLDSGKLKQSNNTAGIINIYEPSEKYFTSEKEKDSEGNYKIYKISVICDPTKNYPFNVTITNYFAPVEIKPNKTTQIKKSATKKDSILTFTMNLTESEWVEIVHRMESAMKNFEQINAQQAYEENEKLRWNSKAVNL